MDIETLKLLAYLLFPIVSGIGAYLYKDLRNDVNKLEQEQKQFLTENQIRALLADKIEPIHTDLKELKDNINIIMGILLEKK